MRSTYLQRISPLPPLPSGKLPVGQRESGYMESIESPPQNPSAPTRENLYADLTSTQQTYQESSYITPLTNNLTDDQIARERERSRFFSESAKDGIYTGLSNDYFSFEGNEDYQVPQNDQSRTYMELTKE